VTIDGICKVEKEVYSRRVTPFAGGVIGELYLPSSVEEAARLLAAFCEEAADFSVLGGGKNTLIAGRVSRAVCLKKMNAVSVDGNFVTAYAGAPLSSVVCAAYENSLTGTEALFGIPGLTGGAVCMNAGAFGTETGDLIESIDILTDDSVITLKPEFSYRNCVFPSGIIISARFSLAPGNRADIKARMNYIAAERRKKHPQEPSLGSVWKAVGSVPAAVHIEKLSLKGLRVGGAVLSPKHCNFIINTGTATAADYIKLMESVEAAAYEKLGITLKREVRILYE
jgi:UDP-N-acetylmuramate dehydrogenase